LRFFKLERNPFHVPITVSTL